MEYINNKKKIIASLLTLDGVDANEIYNTITVPQDTNLADFCIPCFKFAGKFKKNPKMLAEEIVKDIENKLNKNNELDIKVSSLNGYVNFKFNPLITASQVLKNVAKFGSSYGDSNMGNGKTVCIDYSSINIAKPFHIGHLSTTVIGGALYRIYKKMGFNAVGINHLGDWGTQFGKLIVAFKKWGNHEKLKEGGIDYLTEIYVKFHKEAETNEALNEEARSYFKKLEDKDKEAEKLFNEFKEITLTKVKEIYDMLDIKFDSYNGEAFYNDKMAPIFHDLSAQNLIKVSNGAKIVDLSDYNMSPLLLTKADGASLYATRDLAAIYYRKKTYDFYKCLYVVAYQQNLHFQQVFKAIELLGKDYAKDLIHVPFGMVSLESGAMSTRQGNVVKLTDVLQASIEKAYKIIDEKNQNLKDKQGAAKKVGVGAVVFSALSNNRIKDIVFSYDKILNFDGETAPYIQYTHARAVSVLKKIASELKIDKNDIKSYLETPLTAEELQGLNNKESETLVNLIEKMEEVLVDSLTKYEPSVLTRYILEIAKAFNKFYYEHRILNAENCYRRSRISLVFATQTVIKEGLRLLGIQAPDEM